MTRPRAIGEAFGVGEDSPVVGFLTDIRASVASMFDDFDGDTFAAVMTDILDGKSRSGEPA